MFKGLSSLLFLSYTFFTLLLGLAGLILQSTFTGIKDLGKELFPWLPVETIGSIDYATLEKELEWLIDRGSNGIVMAMVSETLRLSSEERDDLASKTCSIIDLSLIHI